MLTLADRIRKEARKEARQETTWEIIKNALKKGLSLKTIEEITGIPAEQINLMKEKMAQS
jgi:predicted transposase/invertase (TIGR01784 family)